MQSQAIADYGAPLREQQRSIPEPRGSEVLDLVRTGRVKPIPLVHRPLAEAGQALQDLRAGRVTGRQVLDC